MGQAQSRDCPLPAIGRAKNYYHFACFLWLVFATKLPFLYGKKSPIFFRTLARAGKLTSPRCVFLTSVIVVLAGAGGYYFSPPTRGGTGII